MDDLTPYNPTPSDLPVKPITPVLSPGLRSLLETERNDSQAVYEIARDPALKAEASAMVPVLRAAAMQLAGEEGVRHVIGRRFAMYPQPDRSDGEWAAWWADYFEVLADVSLAALEAGMLAHVRDPASEFMPKPGKLLELARGAPVKAVTSYTRARRAADYVEPRTYDDPRPVEPPQVRKMPTAADRVAIRDMARQAVKDLQPKADVRLNVALPSIAGKPDEGGLTKEMRELIVRGEG